jgi:hypothetical protein
MADDENREEEFLGDLVENYEAEEEKVDDEVDDPVRIVWPRAVLEICL